MSMYKLTKSRVMVGLQCPKRLWFDLNDPIKQDSHIFHIGNRFGEYIRRHYGSGLDLTGQYNAAVAIEKTRNAIEDVTVPVIYEAAFLQCNTLVRVDVLLRAADGWHLIEAKSSTKLKDEHVKDAAIQSYIISNSGVELSKVLIAHINSSFVYPGAEKYLGLIDEQDVTEQVKILASEVPIWIEQLIGITESGVAAPKIGIGPQCIEPYPCPYVNRCKAPTLEIEVPVSIIPRVGARLADQYSQKGIFDLRDIPEFELENELHRNIRQAHISGEHWFSPTLKNTLMTYGWPRYFVDFETVQQGVPIFPGTTPYQAIPFQWSVHRWDSADQILKLEDGFSFLGFNSPTLFRDFLKSLLDHLGSSGPIFAHHASTEIGMLNFLMNRPECSDLKASTQALIDRVVDTLKLVRDGFYAPQMMGSYSIKEIVKAIPTSVEYSDEFVASGNDAQIAWFCCTDPHIKEEEKLNWIERIKRYCAKDTLAMVDLLRHLSNEGKVIS